MKRNTKKGFTLVELVIVIAVIAILAAVLIPTFGGIIEKANKSAALQEARNEYAAYFMEYAGTEGVEDDLYVYVKGYMVQIENGAAKDNAVAVAENELETKGYTPLTTPAYKCETNHTHTSSCETYAFYNYTPRP